MNNYIFYDFETTGRNSSWDQIIQVGAILTDSNFREIDRFEARSKLKPGQIPYPKAILVNKSSIHDLTKSNSSNFELINESFLTEDPANIKFSKTFILSNTFVNWNVLTMPRRAILNG